MPPTPRELDDIREAARTLQTVCDYLTRTDEANAALNRADTVRYRPLTIATQNALYGLNQIIRNHDQQDTFLDGGTPRSADHQATVADAEAVADAAFIRRLDADTRYQRPSPSEEDFDPFDHQGEHPPLGTWTPIPPKTRPLTGYVTTMDPTTGATTRQPYRIDGLSNPASANHPDVPTPKDLYEGN